MAADDIPRNLRSRVGVHNAMTTTRVALFVAAIAALVGCGSDTRSAPADLPRSPATNPGVVEPPPAAAIVVFLDDGSPPCCVHDRVEAAWSGGRATIAPDAEGKLVVDGLAPTDVVDLVVRRPGHDDVSCAARAGTVVRVPLRPRFRPITGTVVDADGRAVQLAWVRFVPVEWGLEVQTITDFDGAFEEPRALDMDYEVRVMNEDPTQWSEPGEPMGVFRGGARDIRLRSSRRR
jgi:hypothetical protein